MTTEPPDEDALCQFVNGTEQTVDVYVNYQAEAAKTVKPEEDQGAFSIDSDANGLYGTYTFEARPKDQPDAEVLAAASVDFRPGDVYTAAFHPKGEGYQLSVYETDFSPTGASRFQIHHVGAPEEIDWALSPKSEADPNVSVDERSGTLQQGEYQRASDLTCNEYRLEVEVDGEVVAFRQDLELETELLVACYVVGDPSPDLGRDAKKSHVTSKRYHVPAGPEREDETTSPAEAHSTSDDNAAIEFNAEVPTAYETNAYEVPVEATDPDGVVDGFALEAVDPATEGIELDGDSVSLPTEVGGTASARVGVDADVPRGSYDVTLVANPDGMGQRASHTFSLEVEHITADRLWKLVEHYHGQDAVSDDVANELFGLLREAGADPHDGSVGEFLEDVQGLFDHGQDRAPEKAIADVVSLATEQQGRGIDAAAADDVVAEAEVLQQRLAIE